MKHTSGPWNATIYSGTFDQPLITSDDGIIARLHSHSCRRHEANAKLIAAAPEMLNVIEQFIHSVEHEGVIEGRVVDAVRNAKEIIKKATK